MNVPSGYTALDLIGFTDRGSYSPSANYVKNDLVHSGGKVWLCQIDDTTNITPAEGVNWRTWIDEVAYLSGLVDTTITNPANGQILRYDGTLGKWVNANVDSSPTQNSTNLVQSGGVYTALSAKADASGLGTAAAKDSTNAVTQNSSDLVESGAVYTALSGKADASSLGTAAAKDSTNAVTQNSTDLVESGAVYSEVSALSSALTTEANTRSGADTALGNRATALESNGNWRTGLRFKNLGTSFTSAQATALANGDLSEFWNGDYWVINGHTWRIVDNSGIAERRGDTVFHANANNKVTSLVIMPDSNLVGAEAYLIDNANDSGHGYADCAYRTRTDGKGKAQCKTLASNAFGSSHIATHRELMSTGRGANGATGWGWQDADVELPSEVNIYGHNVWAKSSGFEGGGGYNTGDRWGQFKLFELAPYMAINRSQNYWLRDIVSASVFAHVAFTGYAGGDAPSVTYIGVCPHFILV